MFGSGWRGCRVGEWMRGLRLGFTNPVRTGGVLDVCVFWLRWCRWEVGRSGVVGWCYVCVSCESGLSV